MFELNLSLKPLKMPEEYYLAFAMVEGNTVNTPRCPPYVAFPFHIRERAVRPVIKFTDFRSLKFVLLFLAHMKWLLPFNSWKCLPITSNTIYCKILLFISYRLS